MSPGEAEVGRYYDDVIFEAERVRLERDFPVELAITRRRLERHIPDGSMVAEIGVGGAVYSELLARRGCRLRARLPAPAAIRPECAVRTQDTIARSRSSRYSRDFRAGS